MDNAAIQIIVNQQQRLPNPYFIEFTDDNSVDINSITATLRHKPTNYYLEVTYHKVDIDSIILNLTDKKPIHSLRRILSSNTKFFANHISIHKGRERKLPKTTGIRGYLTGSCRGNYI